jgi:putative hydrolase of the HAD superfamily
LLSARNNIRNIIFDLGGVIVNIDPVVTFKAFSALSQKPLEEITEIYHNTAFFRHYESGKISDHDFRNGIRNVLKINSSDDEIDAAWNALLMEIPAGKMEMLRRTRKKFRTFLLSNTNNIHRVRFENVFAGFSPGEDIHTLFEKVYYSFRMDMRKPEPGIFLSVLSENDLEPGETLLIDDNKENIESAGSLGMKTMLVEMNQPAILIPA